MCACVCVCMRACVRACVRACARAGVCELFACDVQRICFYVCVRHVMLVFARFFFYLLGSGCSWG